MRRLLICCAAVIAGCTTTSRIVPAGEDTYMISAANDACGNCEPPEIRATEQANAHCAKMNKVMVLKTTKNQTFDIGYGKRYTLTFACEAGH